MRRRLLATALVLGLSLAGCGGGDDEGVADEPQVTAPEETPEPGAGQDDGGAEPAGDEGFQTGEVVAQGFRFEPQRVQVTPGAEVSWRNEDGVAHTVTADDGSFDLELPPSGGQAERLFTDEGTYAYHCEVHPSMRGEVVVSG